MYSVSSVIRMCIVIGSLSLFPACGDKDTPEPVDMNKIKTAKFTITVTGIKATADRDYASITFSAAAVPGGSATIWKVNGVDRPNESVVNFTHQDFIENGTKTLTVELAKPVIGINGRYQFINFNSSFTFTYTAVINGAEVKNLTQDVTQANSIDASYDY